MGDRLYGLAMLVLGVLFYFVFLALQPPVPVGADAPADLFSAARAEQILRDVLGDQTPHPVGSEANAAVRERIVAQLTALDIKSHVQRAVGCSIRRSICANVENIVAEIPGQSADAVLVMAHYDSVPDAPGAADDGAGVAAIIEAARVLVAQPASRNRIILLFSDAEEVGLLGADAFFTAHRWKDEVKAVVNLEGAGSGGPALLLRTSAQGGLLLNAYRQVASAPVALSASQEVFARMPNDTDFSVSDGEGIPSIDFAFSFEFNHYHTPLDSIENLDKGALQHHGDNMLPLVQRLATLDLNDSAETFAYLTVQQSVWISWPTSWALGLAVAALLVLAIATMMLRAHYSLFQLLAGMGLALLSLVGSVLICAGAVWLAGELSGTIVKFPADFWPWRLIIYAGAFSGVCLTGWLALGRIGFWPLFLGLWWLLGGVAVALAVTMPLAANLVLNAVIVASVLTLMIALLGDAQHHGQQWLLAMISTVALAYGMLTLAYVDEQVQGYTLAPAIYVPLLIAFLPLLPLRPGKRFVMLAGMVLVAGCCWAMLSPKYSEHRPQHVTFRYVLDQDNATALWGVYSANPLPDRIALAAGSAAVDMPSVPWSTFVMPTFTAPVVVLAKPEIESVRTDDKVVVSIRTTRNVDYLALILPVSAGISDITMNGRQAVMSEQGDYQVLTFFAPSPSSSGERGESVEFGFRTQQASSFQSYVVEGTYGLPRVPGNPAKARTSLAVPQHQGDQTVSFQRFEI